MRYNWRVGRTLRDKEVGSLFIIPKKEVIKVRYEPPSLPAIDAYSFFEEIRMWAEEAEERGAAAEVQILSEVLDIAADFLVALEDFE